MKKKALILVVILSALAVLFIRHKESRNRQAYINLLSGVGTHFFHVDYPKLPFNASPPTIPLPLDSLSDKFGVKIIKANLPNEVIMLNVPYEVYLRANAGYHPSADMPRGLPLIWTQMTSWGREYYIYWGYDANGIMTPDELSEFLKWFRNRNEPNKAMEPTPVSVTIPADAGLAPLTSAAHLVR